MDGDCHNSLRLRIPELPVTALRCSEFFEPVLLEQPNQLRPRHNVIFEPNVGLSQTHIMSALWPEGGSC